MHLLNHVILSSLKLILPQRSSDKQAPNHFDVQKRRQNWLNKYLAILKLSTLTSPSISPKRRTRLVIFATIFGKHAKINKSDTEEKKNSLAMMISLTYDVEIFFAIISEK